MHFLIAVLNAPDKLDSNPGGLPQVGGTGGYRDPLRRYGLEALSRHPDLHGAANAYQSAWTREPDDSDRDFRRSHRSRHLADTGIVWRPVMPLSALLTFYGLQIGSVDVSQGLFSIVILGVVLSEMVSPMLTTETLHRAGEISSLVEKAPEQRRPVTRPKTRSARTT